ncbi:ribokinase [Halobacillus locisalis]|uniref:Ribokinase n=1 Tax=Halobacillus locisalis TaxID=220753 RepID=A0A838CS32_9BACI|nr:ribokinase [Halobacillus locisalis]MBA2174887.1 ribokinase [Halobacillus locisalis]
MTKKPVVTVIGSINMDLTVSTKVVPRQGETVMGDSFATFPGGKGANQAVAAARLGGDVRMIGAVGSDVFGNDLLEHLRREGIDTSGVASVDGVSTGTATIIVSNGDNRIIVAPGANHEVTVPLVERFEEMIKESDIVLVQLEIPLSPVEYVSKLAVDHGVPLIVNPAPYQTLPEAVLRGATYLTPNESEATLLEADSPSTKEKWITTIGSAGVRLNKDDVIVPGYLVDAVDTTGAGDTFNGALATKLAKGSSLEDAAQFANAASALSVQKLGAQQGMPHQEEVESFLKQQG